MLVFVVALLAVVLVLVMVLLMLVGLLAVLLSVLRGDVDVLVLVSIFCAVGVAVVGGHRRC